MTYHPSLIFLEEKKNQVMLRLLAQFQITRGLLEILAIGFLPENSISNLFFFLSKYLEDTIFTLSNPLMA
jgi:hypothetical protein